MGRPSRRQDATDSRGRQWSTMSRNHLLQTVAILDTRSAQAFDRIARLEAELRAAHERIQHLARAASVTAAETPSAVPTSNP